MMEFFQSEPEVTLGIVKAVHVEHVKMPDLVSNSKPSAETNRLV